MAVGEMLKMPVHVLWAVGWLPSFSSVTPLIFVSSHAETTCTVSERYAWEICMCVHWRARGLCCSPAVSAYCNDILIVTTFGDFFSVQRVSIISENKYFPGLFQVVIQRDLMFLLLLYGVVQKKGQAV